jgi:hypothetical protein
METSAIVTRSAPKRNHDLLLYYWIMFCCAPGTKTLPGECVDLGEIGGVKELRVKRMTSYSIAEPSAGPLKRKLMDNILKPRLVT